MSDNIETENNIDIEVVAENIAELLTNSVNLTDVYYDLFLNTEPLDIELQMYNEDNELIIPQKDTIFKKNQRLSVITKADYVKEATKLFSP